MEWFESAPEATMALYKYGQFVTASNHAAFDQLHGPGATAPYSGIYRCEGCGKECVSTVGHPLPPQNHHQHNPARAISWRLIVTDG
jgi:hypothetical protein